MRYRLITFLVFGAVLVGIGEWAVKNHRLQSLDNWWLEFCVGNAGDKISEPEVTLVRITSEWKPLMSDTLSRIDYAAILGFVAEFEPVSVAFEPALEFEESHLVNDENAAINPLKEFALKLPELTLGCIVENGQPPEKPEENVAFPALTQVEGSIENVTPLTRTITPPDAQMLVNGTPAFTVIELDAKADSGGGIRVPLVARQGDKVVPGFIVQALARYADVPLDQIGVTFAEKRSVLRIGDRYTIPIDSRGRMKIYEYSGVGRLPVNSGNQSGSYRSIESLELTVTRESDPKLAGRLTDLEDEFESLRSNLVVIGDDHAANRHIEFANGGPEVSQAELLTRAIATIQSGRFIERWPAWARYFAAAAIAGLAVFLFRFSRRKVFVVGLLVALLFFFVVVALFTPTLAWAPPFPLMSLFGLILVVGLILPGPERKKAEDDLAPKTEPDQEPDHPAEPEPEPEVKAEAKAKEVEPEAAKKPKSKKKKSRSAAKTAVEEEIEESDGKDA